MRINQLMIAVIIILSLPAVGCSGRVKPHRESCATQLNLAWKELDLAKAAGFSGTVSYGKAVSLLTLAKTMQTVENYDNCFRHAKDARFYIAQSRQGT